MRVMFCRSDIMPAGFFSATHQKVVLVGPVGVPRLHPFNRVASCADAALRLGDRHPRVHVRPRVVVLRPVPPGSSTRQRSRGHAAAVAATAAVATIVPTVTVAGVCGVVPAVSLPAADVG